MPEADHSSLRQCMPQARRRITEIPTTLHDWGCEATPILGSSGFLPFNSPPAYISFRGSARSALPQSGYSRRARPPCCGNTECRADTMGTG